MEGVSLENFNKFEPTTIPVTQFNSNLPDEFYQDASTTATQIFILLSFLISKYL